jgi:hypothetical protein
MVVRSRPAYGFQGGNVIYKYIKRKKASAGKGVTLGKGQSTGNGGVQVLTSDQKAPKPVNKIRMEMWLWERWES